MGAATIFIAYDFLWWYHSGTILPELHFFRTKFVKTEEIKAVINAIREREVKNEAFFMCNWAGGLFLS